uniref:Putative secreted protein n=1 Tax=Ixodes ricinus TaxID=34613 RepID=A0A6B0UXT7_IXORI
MLIRAPVLTAACIFSCTANRSTFVPEALSALAAYNKIIGRAAILRQFRQGSRLRHRVLETILSRASAKQSTQRHERRRKPLLSATSHTTTTRVHDAPSTCIKYIEVHCIFMWDYMVCTRVGREGNGPRAEAVLYHVRASTERKDCPRTSLDAKQRISIERPPIHTC